MPINDVIIINTNPTKKHKVHLKFHEQSIVRYDFPGFFFPKYTHNNIYHISNKLLYKVTAPKR